MDYKICSVAPIAGSSKREHVVHFLKGKDSYSEMRSRITGSIHLVDMAIMPYESNFVF